jgi:multisubunit Na+/H+ antiporter MnhF subunit
MDALLVGELVLIGIGLPAALWMATRREALDRLVGMEIAGVEIILSMLVFSEIVEQPSYLIVPMVAAVLAFAGTLVFTRMLAPRP